MTQRRDKVAQRIKEEVSKILHDEIKDPRIGFITITNVELTNDLRFGKIFYSILGNDDQKKEASQGLESAYKYVRRLLSERLKLRYAPDIVFKLDTTAEYNIRIGQIFEQLENERSNKKGTENND